MFIETENNGHDEAHGSIPRDAKLNCEYHVQVTDVADGCAASGLVMKGDTILSINGTLVTDEVQGRALARAAVGKVIFSILRGDA